MVISIKIPKYLSVSGCWLDIFYLAVTRNYCEIVIRIELVKLVNPLYCLRCSRLLLARNDILNLTADSSRLSPRLQRGK